MIHDKPFAKYFCNSCLKEVKVECSVAICNILQLQCKAIIVSTLINIFETKHCEQSQQERTKAL